MKKTNIKKPEQNIKEIIYKFLKPQDYQIFIFGSRVAGEAGEFSDFDIGISGSKHLTLKKLALIKEAFEESDLPYMVDIIDFSTVTPYFKEEALSRIIKL